MAERLFGGQEGLTSGSVYDSARIEAVLGAEHGLEHVAGPVLDGALDDDVKELRGVSLLDDHFARPEIPDIQRRLQFLDFLVRQAVERRIESVKPLHQPPRRGARRVELRNRRGVTLRSR